MYVLWKKCLPRGAKRLAMVSWYDLLARLDSKDEILFLNHGYASPEGRPGTLDLESDMEQHRYPVQLYDLLARQADWRGKDALEVSSGLGGGMMYIARQFQPNSFTGLDISRDSVSACRRRCRDPMFRFVTGDAEAIPFDDASFDVIINVESSLNYRNVDAFLGEVARLLRPGGTFLFGDYRRSSKMPRLRKSLARLPLAVKVLSDITPGIVRGLEINGIRKRRLIDRHVPFGLRGVARKFAGLSPSKDIELDNFRFGRKSYLMAVLEKPA